MSTGDDRGRGIDRGRDTTKLFGRREQLASLERSIADSMTRPVTVLIEGPAGMGKSALLRHVARRLADESSEPLRRVIHAGADPARRSQPFSLFDDVFAALPGAVLPADAAHGGQHGSTSPFGSAPDLRLQQIERICETVETACAHGPLALLLEDLHSADSSSLAALRALAERLAGFPLLIAATTRPASSLGHATGELAAFVRAANSRIAVGPLTATDARTMIEALLGTVAHPTALTTALAALSATGGSPLLVHELAASILLGGDTENGVPTGDLADSVERRWRMLEARSQRALLAAAVLGVRFDISEVADMIECSVAAAISALGAAEDVGLVLLDTSPPRFTHDEIRDRVSALPEQATRRYLATLAAATARRHAAPAARVLSYLEASDAAVEEMRPWRQQAAAEAERRDPAVAYALYGELIEGESVGSQAWVDYQMRRVEAAVSSGLLTAAVDGVALIQRSSELDDQQLFELEWWRASVLFMRGQVATAIDALARAVASSGSPELRARQLGLMALCYTAAYSPETGAVAEQAVDAAQKCADPVAMTMALSALSRHLCTEWDLRGGLRMAAQAVQIADTTTTVLCHRYQPIVFHNFAQIDLLRYDQVRLTAQTGRRTAERLGAQWAVPFFNLQVALVDLLEGRVDDSIAEASAGRSAAEVTGTTFVSGWLAGIESLALGRRDDPDAAAEALARSKAGVEGAYGSGIDAAALAEAMWMRRIAGPCEALRFLREAWNFLADVGVDTARLLLTAPAAVMAAEQRDGDFLDELAVFADRWSNASGEAAPTFVRHLASAIHHDDAEEAMRALEVLRASRWRLSLADTLVVCADTFGRAGSPVDPAVLLAEAEMVYSECGALADVADLRRRALHPQRRGRGRPRSVVRVGWESLTATERLVAEAIADGKSNKAAAAELLVSVRTVESHVSRLLTKLQVDSRLQVALLVERSRAS